MRLAAVPFLLATLLPFQASYAQDEAVSLAIDNAQTRVLALAYKGGAASAVAHDHVIHARTVTGTGTWHPTDASQCSISVDVKVHDLFPDANDMRQMVGLPGTLTDGQRDEILGHVLARYQLWAEQHSQITFRSTSISGTTGSVTVQGDFTMRGVTKPLSVPMQLTETDGTVRAVGQVQIKQSDFGYQPYSALFGALKVKDAVDLVVDITLQPAG